VNITGRRLLWGIPAVIYMAFVFWYTDFNGPMAEAEIEHYVQKMRENNAPASQIARLREFMAADTGRQFLMVNIIDMAETPDRIAGIGPGESSGEVMNRYMEHMYPALFSRACHPAFFGVAVFGAMDIVGIQGAERWTQAALFRYRSRRDLVDIATNPEFSGRHEFKLAALSKTIAYPVEAQLYLSDPRALLLLILLVIAALGDIFIHRRRAG
jgi:hypothetical protein